MSWRVARSPGRPFLRWNAVQFLGGVVLTVLALLALTASSAYSQQAPATPGGANQAPARAGIIRGRILAGDTGRPLRRAQVTLTAPELGRERRTANTGIDGRYEFKDLPAGRYVLRAVRSGYLALQFGQRRAMEQARPLQLVDGQMVDNADFSLPRIGMITGHVFDEAGEPIAGVLVWAMRPAYVEGRRQLVIAATSGGFEGTDDRGEYRLTGLVPGRYYIRAMTRETWTVSRGGTRELMGFIPTFSPTASSVERARLVEVGVGQRIQGIDIALTPGRPASLSGFAFDSQGRPLAGRSVSLGVRFLRETPGGGGMGAGSASVGPDGSFMFRNVTPGEYELRASTGELSAGGELAVMQVAINGADVDNVRLTTTAGWSVSGRIVTEDGVAPNLPRDRVTVRGTTLLQMPGVGAGEITNDWTFAIKSLVGPARLSATVPDGWMVKGIRQKDRDITSSYIDLRSGEVLSDIEVIVTNRVTRVSGQLADDRGAPLANGTVLVFSEDRSRWGDATAFVRTARPDQQGRYEITGLPAGEYLAIALDYLQDGSWNDPEYLESLRRSGRAFTLGDGGAQTLSLKLVEP